MKERGADSKVVNTLGAGSVLVSLWKKGEVHDIGRFKVTRTGKVSEIGV